MFSYRGIISKRLSQKEKEQVEMLADIYEVTVPTISMTKKIRALVLTSPGIYTSYDTGDQVLITQISSSGEYVVLGLLQRYNPSEGSKVSTMVVEKAILEGGTLGPQVKVVEGITMLELYDMVVGMYSRIK